MSHAANRALTRDEIQVLVDHLKSDKAKAENILVEILLTTGMRTAELYRLKIGCFDPVAGILSVEEPAKKSKKREFDLNPNGLARRLARAIHDKDMILDLESQLVWVWTPGFPNEETFKRWIRFMWKRITIYIFGPRFNLGLHSLRHTYASLIRNFASIEVVKQQLGHASLQSTYNYLAKPTREEMFTVQREAAAMLMDKSYMED